MTGDFAEMLHAVFDAGAGYVISCALGPLFDAIDREMLGTELAVPVFVIQGAEDFTTPTSLARAYVDSLHAPRKAFATIEGAGHFAVFTKQDAFLKELKARVLLLTR